MQFIEIEKARNVSDESCKTCVQYNVQSDPGVISADLQYRPNLLHQSLAYSPHSLRGQRTQTGKFSMHLLLLTQLTPVSTLLTAGSSRVYQHFNKSVLSSFGLWQLVKLRRACTGI